jgi:predicted HTH transcriptional regulator
MRLILYPVNNMFDQFIEIVSPGHLPNGLTIEKSAAATP